MVRRFGVLSSAGVLLASVFVAVATLGVSAAHAASFEDWAVVSAGQYHSCGVRKNGKLYCWGDDTYGAVGDGDGATPHNAPVRVGAFEDWATVSAGGFHTCGVRKNGKLYCWGYDIPGQVGDGDGATPHNAPVRVGTFEDWVGVSAGYVHTCGVRKNGKLYCWGSDDDGRVGDGDDGDAPETAPRRIGAFEDWVGVSAGGAHTCGVRKNGKLYCWGSDGHGQVGDGGSNLNISAPGRIGTFEDWVGVSAGLFHSCGVRSNGKLYCWGDDDSEQIGNGDAPVLATSPQRIGTFEDWASVSAGYTHTCGVRKNGKLYCWGSDNSGRIGDGDDGDAPEVAPRRVGTFEDWAHASAGGTQTCGIRSPGDLYCWGSDNFGQVGDGVDDSPDTVPHRI